MSVPSRSSACGAGFVDAGVVELADRYAAGTATPVDATRACLGRIERHDPALHAFTDVDAGGALAAADASAARWSAGRPLSPIDGVPIGLKANLAVRGLPWTGGLAARRGQLAADDAVCVARLRAAGAVLLGGLNMDEAALGATGDNPWYGRTRNPHGADRSPGGSSAGAAAAVAAGFCAAAIGTDTMGSVRIPAACCGVVGLSPRRGTIDRGGVLPLSWSFDNVGVLARSVDDVENVLAVVARPDRAAPAGPPPQPVVADLAVLVPPDDIALDPAVRRAFDAARHAACEAGLRPHPLRLVGIDLKRLAKALLLVVEVEAGVEHEALLRTRPEGLSTSLRGLLDWGARQTAGRLGAALRELHDARTALQAQLTAIAPGAALLMPVVPCAAFGFDAPPPQIAVFTGLGSIAGLAGLSLPMGLAGDDAPASVQILSADNATTLALARLLAAHLPAVGAPAGFH